MRKLVGGSLALIAVSLLLAGPAQAQTAMGEDSFQECSYPRMTDLLMMRPVGMIGLGISSTIFVVTSPFTLIVAGDEIGGVFDDLVGAPAQFLFTRPLGECQLKVI